jgi:bifunctional non-homologous end joining protein LigD
VLDEQPGITRQRRGHASVHLPTGAVLRNQGTLSRIRSLVIPPAWTEVWICPHVSIVECCRVALALQKLFAAQGLECFAKTSGSKGLQLYVPLNTPTTYAKTKAFAQAVSAQLQERAPELIVTQMRRALRPGKVFIDWSQNDPHKTTVSVYSLPARFVPTVSIPVTWAEVRKCARSGDPENLVFDAAAVLRRVKRRGDLFAPLLTLRQHLPKVP